MKTEKTNTAAAEEKKVNKGLDTLVNILLVAVVIFGIICSYTAFVSARGDGVPDLFGFRFFAIQSQSMEPTIMKGDLIVDTALKSFDDLEKGDVITFWTIISGERVLNTHRIVDITDNGNYLYFTTRGDNNTIDDALGVHQGEIVGKYLFAIPKLGDIISFLQTSMGFLLVIVLPVFLFFIYNLVQFFKVLLDYRMEKMKLQLKQDILMEEKLRAEIAAELQREKEQENT